MSLLYLGLITNCFQAVARNEIYRTARIHGSQVWAALDYNAVLHDKLVNR
jgi:hypothetical protein